MTKASRALALLSLLVVSAPAEAGIVCDGTFQVVHGYSVSSPYCQDEDLARHVRSQGASVSAETLRQNPNAKREACAGVANVATCSTVTSD